MSGDYEMILDRSLDEVQPPKLVPAGPWVLKGASFKLVDKEFEDKDTGETVKYKQAVIGYLPSDPLPGVDMERVEEGGFDGQMIFVRKNVRSAGQEYALIQFMQKHGIDTQSRTWEQIAKAFRGSTIIGNVTEGTYTSGDETIPTNGVDGFQAVG